jgi:hypothetical protein
MKYQLPTPIPANLTYEAVLIENMKYDGSQYTADVFGVADGMPMPLIIKTASGIVRVPTCTITDAEIDQVIAANPAITVRLEAGMMVAMERLYAMVREVPNA